MVTFLFVISWAQSQSSSQYSSWLHLEQMIQDIGKEYTETKATGMLRPKLRNNILSPLLHLLKVIVKYSPHARQEDYTSV